MRLLRRAAAWVLSLVLLLSTALAAVTPAVSSRTTAVRPVIYGYQEGLAQAQADGLWGFADVAGNIVIDLQYDSVVSFSLGLATVEKNGKLGVIRPDGNYLIRPEYDSLLPLNCGLYIAQKGPRWGIVSVVGFRDAAGRWTNEAMPLGYQLVEKGTSGGLDAVILTPPTGSKIIVPMFQLPAKAAERGLEGSQFPFDLIKRAIFSDVGPRDWFSLWVDIAYNIGLVRGVGSSLFEPQRSVKVAEAIQVAANMDSRFQGDDFRPSSKPGGPWYTSALNYCLAHGIVRPGQFENYDRPITRRELAQLFNATGLAHSLPLRNSLNRIRSAVGDVTESDPGAAAIWDLYAKGIFNGKDGKLSFHPDDPVSRAETAALAARLARPEQRLELFP